MEMRSGRNPPRSRAALSRSVLMPVSMASTLAVPAGRIASGTLGVHHSFGHFVDGAVPARRYDHAGALGDAAPRQLAGGARTGGGHQYRVPAAFLQKPRGTLQPLAPCAAQPSGVRIENDCGFLRVGDDFPPDSWINYR